MTTAADLLERVARRSSPLLELLDVRFAVVAEQVELRCRIAEKHCRSHGIAHGGVLCTLLDTALGAAAYQAAAERLAETGQELVTLQLETHFIRPAWVGEELRGRAEVVHRGRSTIVVRGDIVTRGDAVVVSGAATFLPTEIAPEATT